MLRIAICVNDKKTYDLIKKLYDCISEDTIKIYIFNIKDESINNFNEADYDKIFFVHENATESIVQKIPEGKFINSSYIQEINPENIEYIRVDSVYTYIKYKNIEELYMTRRSIREWQEDDKYENFIRINKKYLVNLKYIKSINKHTVLSGGEVLVTKRGYIKEYNRILKEYRIRKYKERMNNTQDI